MNKKEPKFVDQLTHLFILAMEDEINEEEFLKLTQILKVNAVAREYYYDFIASYVGLDQLSILSEIDDDQENLFSHEVWKDLLEHEQTAPTIEIPKEKPPRELIQKVIYPPGGKRKISKLNIFFMLLNTAAILLLFLYLRFTASNHGVEVVTLTDSIDAKWADVTGSMDKGTRLATPSDKLFLQKGLAELVFDNNAKIVIEGPAEFSLLAEDRINLQYGRIYATVPREAIGFTINTPTSRIIDLGTEFGVQADPYGDLYLHVIKGKTSLITGGKSNKVNLEVREGQAKKVFGATQEVSDIPCQKELFVRTLESKTKFVWKGQNQISLADIVGGGNGLGTGQVNTGVDPLTGQKAKSVFRDKNVTNEYHPVLSNTFIDGVFVPNGRTEQVVSSMRHVFQECPVTSGIFYTGIINTPVTAGKEWVLAGLKSNSELMAEVKSDSMETYPCILMHANLGITFDLQAIRSMLPESKITCFRSPFGLSPLTDSMFNADFWVLVDGKLKFKQTQVKENGKAGFIDIPLSPTERFLTLVITDGGDPKEGTVRIQTPIYGDWCVFMEPVLVLE